jgi:hypothetical protein
MSGVARIVGWVVLIGAGGMATAATDKVSIGDANIEFEWQSIAHATGARQEALGFLMHPPRPHQVCAKSMSMPAGVDVVQFAARDAQGRQTWSHNETLRDHPAVDTLCVDLAITDRRAVPGMWQFTIAINGTPVANKSIEVAASLAEAHFYADPNRPYTRGRINFTGATAAAQWNGYFLWEMEIGASGHPVAVRNVELEGPAKGLSAAGLNAARLYWFPANPARKTKPYVVRERYELAPTMPGKGT